MIRVNDDDDELECDCEECCPVGPQGFMGMQGQAVFGMQGPTGFQGIIAIGAQGPQGFQGSTQLGALGYRGSQGSKAPSVVGAEGPQGPQASNDFKGPIGYQGPQGDVGPIALIGQQGFQGNLALRGMQGFTGPQAPITTGPPGDLGPSGAPLQSMFQTHTGGIYLIQAGQGFEMDGTPMLSPGPFYIRWQVTVSFVGRLIFSIGDLNGVLSASSRIIVSNSFAEQSIVVCTTAMTGIFLLYLQNPTPDDILINVINLSWMTLTR